MRGAPPSSPELAEVSRVAEAGSSGQESDAQRRRMLKTRRKLGRLEVKVDLRGAPSVGRCLFASLKTFPRRDLNPGLVGENHIS